MACGSAQNPGAVEDLDPQTLYPLQEGNVWTYDVDTGVDIPVLAISRVTAVQGNRVSVANNNSDPIVYELRPEGIYRAGSDTWLLRRPLEVGASWPGAGGRQAKVTSVTERVEAAGETFSGCVRVEETDGRQTVATVYCPHVGPVLLDTSMQMDMSAEAVQVRGRLRAYQLQQLQLDAAE